MSPDTLLIVACCLSGAFVLVCVLLLLRRGPDAMAALAAAHREEAEGIRAALAQSERALAATLGQLSTTLEREQGAGRLLLEVKLREMEQSLNRGLHHAVETQMESSFQRVIDQFTQVQRAMGDVQAMTAQIGDLRRLFSNVKARGAWGEMHLQMLLEDVLPHGGWVANRRMREDTDDHVEFAIAMPMRGTHRPWLAIDAKFPAADYDRLLLAAEAGDAEAERQARRALEAVLRAEARTIGAKYINPPVTVDFAVMYLPTDGLYVEAARMPGLIEEMNRQHRVLVMGPSLAPALLRTIHLGVLSLSLEEKAEEIQQLLGATRTEMGRMDEVLARLAKQADTFSNTISDARTRARQVSRRLRGVTAQEDVLEE